MKKIISKIIVAIAIVASTTLLGSCKELAILDNVSNVDMIMVGDGVRDHSAKVELGSTLQLSCRGLVYEDSKITWKSDNENIATVDENGLVTPVATGLVTIMASTQSEYVYQSGYVVVTVLGTSITLGAPVDQSLVD